MTTQRPDFDNSDAERFVVRLALAVLDVGTVRRGLSSGNLERARVARAGAK